MFTFYDVLGHVWFMLWYLFLFLKQVLKKFKMSQSWSNAMQGKNNII